MNHYQDISVRRVIAELVDDPGWPDVIDTATEDVDLIDLGTGAPTRCRAPAGSAAGISSRSANPTVARLPAEPGGRAGPRSRPDHHAAGRVDWYHAEGCGHLSVEAFWQMSKVIEVRYDRFLELGPARVEALAGL